MSDRAEQSYEDGDESSGKQYQSLWMAHWTRTTCNTVPQSVNHSSFPSRNNLVEIENSRNQARLLDRFGIESEYSRSAKRYREVEVNETVEKEQHNYHWPQFTRQRDPALPSTSKNPNPLSTREKIEFKNLERKKPRTVHDVETMRIISQTTHSFLITKKTDVSLRNDSQRFRESRVSSQLTGNRSKAPLFGHGSRGVTIQSLSSSNDSDREEKIPRFKSFKGKINESLTDTNTMDIDFVKEKNYNFGAFTPIPKKVVIKDPSESHQPKMTSDQDKVKNTNRKTELPDINIELTAPPETAETSTENNPEPSSSKTQSLDMDVLFPSANPETKHAKAIALALDPTNRWLNRLKSTSSQPANNMLICTKTNNEEGITLDHPWIQRWRHNRGKGTQNKRKAENLSPRDSKIDIKEKQFPSIAAMALMGKAFTGFQPCMFRKRGSFLVWNTANL